MTLNTVRRVAVLSASAPSTPRLRMEPTGSRRTRLDGGWWPRSTDPVAELPGLVLAIDKLRGPVTRLILSADGWDDHPRRLTVAGRVLRLGYFTSQPAALLTALCDNGDRVDLLIVPPNTEAGTADAAMILAATTSNVLHAQRIVSAAGATFTRDTDISSKEAWETDGGRLRRRPVPPARARDRRSLQANHPRRKVVMANKTNHKVGKKKAGRTLKEKRATKKAKHAAKSAPLIPPTGH